MKRRQDPEEMDMDHSESSYDTSYSRKRYANSDQQRYEFSMNSPPPSPVSSSSSKEQFMDIVSSLPREISLHIFAYLAEEDLVRASETCSSWFHLANDEVSWRKRNQVAGYPDETNALSDPRLRYRWTSLWRLNYARHRQIQQHWTNGTRNPPKVLPAHSGHVITCLLMTEDGKLISTGDDFVAKVFSTETGQCLFNLVGHTGGIWAAEVEKDILVTASTDRTLRVWNLQTGECDSILRGHTSTVRCVAMKSNVCVSGARDSTLRVWSVDLESRRYRGGSLRMNECKGLLIGHTAAVRCVCFDGRTVVSGSYDHQVRVWDAQALTCLHVLSGHESRVYSLQFDGVYAVSGSVDATIRVWDTRSGRLVQLLMGHDSLTSGLVMLPGNLLVSGNADSTVRMWDLTTGACIATLGNDGNKHDSGVTCVDVNQNFVVTSSDDGTVKLWDVRTGKFIRDVLRLPSRDAGGVVWRILANKTKLACAVGSRDRENQVTNVEETKILLFDFDSNITKYF